MGPCAIVIDPGSRRTLADRLKPFSGKYKLAVVSDENVSVLYREKISEILNEVIGSHDWIIIPSGEKSKSVAEMEKICRKLVENRYGREDILLAFGGGVVGDLTGFLASVYLRGVKWIVMPTTLMSQADASIGGKVAVHFGGFKNVLGAFHQPYMVLIDPEFLLTLTTREFYSGLAEIMKMAILPGGENFHIWNAGMQEGIYKREPKALTAIIEDACRLKSSIVEKDECDHAGRMILNLGHTVGHSLESVTGFNRYTHGEAVCAGILFMCELSHANGDMNDDDFMRIRNLFAPIAREIPMIEHSWDALSEAIDRDKKWRASGLKWVYPLGIGRVAVREIQEGDIVDTWERFRSDFSRSFGRVK